MKTVFNNLESAYQYYQSLLLPFAYNITGDSLAAEDVVQEVLNHYFLSEKDHIKNASSYLIKSVVNKSINEKQLLRSRKEVYPGQWLPSPIFTEEYIYQDIDNAHWMSYALLVLLERLSPKERAVFILKETFGYAHDDIAQLLEITASNSRQLLKRAKQHINIKEASYTEGPENDLVVELVSAIQKKDLEKVHSLLLNDVKCVSDGGKKVSSARKIIYGKHNTTQLLQALHQKYMPADATLFPAIINHMPAIVYKLDGTIFRSVVFEVKENLVTNIFVMVSPEKLQLLNHQYASVT